MTRIFLLIRLFPALLALLAAAPSWAAFTDNGDGTVSDSVTGLMWDKCSWGQNNNTTCSGGAASTHAWSQALGVSVTANAASYKGYSDWRLPNIKELESLAKIDASNPAIDTTVFPNTPSSWFWSSTTGALNNPDRAVLVNFVDGDFGHPIKTLTYYVRLVRSGQSFASFDSQLGITYSAATFSEAAANDGSVTTSITLTLSGDTYAADVVSAGRITASNVPAGLTANFARTSATVITATLTGNATSHANANDIANLTFTFANGAFTNTATAANVSNYSKNNLVVDFNDPAADTTPDAFAFTVQSGAALATETVSNTITVTGINSAANISISGGEYRIGSGGWTSGAGTVNNGDTVTVKLTSSSGYSTAATATLTIGGVSAAFSVTTQGAPSYDPGPPPAPSVINAPRAVDTTLTGITPVNAALGSTLTIPAGAPVSGVAITLAAPVAGVAAEPVAIRIGGNALTVTPTGANVVVTLKTVTLNGVPTQVLAVSSGALTVSATAGQPLLTVSNSGVVVTAGANGGTVAFDGSGAAILGVTSGYVVLPANAFASATGNNFAALKDGKLYAGEVASLDATGKVASVRLGSLAGDGGAVGDPLKTAGASGLVNKAVVPNLKGKVARVSEQQEFADAIAASLGQDFAAQGQNGDGVLRLAFTGGTAYALPVGSIAVDTSRADGITFTGNGKAEVAKNGVVATFSPAVSDFAGLAGVLAKQDRNASLAVLEDGMVHVVFNGVTYALQPAWMVSQAGGGQAGIAVDGQGNFLYQDGTGNRQTLYPVFADLPQLVAAFGRQDAAVSVTPNGDGTYSAKLLGKSYVLAPDYGLFPTPADKAGKEWWQGDDGKLFIRNRDGSAQGFAVR